MARAFAGTANRSAFYLPAGRFSRPRLAANVDHRVAVGADHGQRLQVGHGGSDAVRQRLEVVHLRVAITKCTVPLGEVEAAPRDLTDQSPVVLRLRGRQLRNSKTAFPYSMLHEALGLFALQCCEHLRFGAGT
jgi:hypothetical protein